MNVAGEAEQLDAGIGGLFERGGERARIEDWEIDARVVDARVLHLKNDLEKEAALSAELKKAG